MSGLSYAQLSKEVRQLRAEKVNLQRDEEIIKALLAKLKTQLSAIQIEELEIRNRKPELTEEYIAELAGTLQPAPAKREVKESLERNPNSVLEQMVKGQFIIEEESL